MYEDSKGGEIYINVESEGLKKYKGGMNNLVTAYDKVAKVTEKKFTFDKVLKRIND
jgi:hypothetical protein